MTNETGKLAFIQYAETYWLVINMYNKYKLLIKASSLQD